MSLEPKPMEAGERLLTELSKSPVKEVVVKQLPNGMLVWNPAYDLSKTLKITINNLIVEVPDIGDRRIVCADILKMFAEAWTGHVIKEHNCMFDENGKFYRPDDWVDLGAGSWRFMTTQDFVRYPV